MSRIGKIVVIGAHALHTAHVEALLIKHKGGDIIIAHKDDHVVSADRERELIMEYGKGVSIVPESILDDTSIQRLKSVDAFESYYKNVKQRSGMSHITPKKKKRSKNKKTHRR